MRGEMGMRGHAPEDEQPKEMTLEEARANAKAGVRKAREILGGLGDESDLTRVREVRKRQIVEDVKRLLADVGNDDDLKRVREIHQVETRRDKETLMGGYLELLSGKMETMVTYLGIRKVMDALLERMNSSQAFNPTLESRYDELARSMRDVKRAMGTVDDELVRLEKEILENDEN